jgi:hypothetical protein
MSRRLFTLAALCCGLMQAASAKDPAPVPMPQPFDVAQAASSLLEVSSVKALKGIKRVAVPQFSIEFITSDSVSSETSGFASAGRSSVTGHYRLVGVSEAEFQALAEQLYAAFVQALQAQGLEVLTQQELAASPTWNKLVAAGLPMPQRAETSITVAPPGMALYGVNRTMANSGTKGLMGALTGISAVGSAISVAGDNITMQQELGGAALVDVAMRLHFAQLTNENRGFLGRLSSTAEVSAKLHPILTQARLSVQAGAESSVINTKAPLLLDPAAFIEVRKEAATTGEIAGAVAAGLLRIAIGSKDSSSSVKYQVVTDPQRYGEHVGANLKQTHAMLIARMVTER